MMKPNHANVRLLAFPTPVTFSPHLASHALHPPFAFAVHKPLFVLPFSRGYLQLERFQAESTDADPSATKRAYHRWQTRPTCIRTLTHLSLELCDQSSESKLLLSTVLPNGAKPGTSVLVPAPLTLTNRLWYLGRHAADGYG